MSNYTEKTPSPQKSSFRDTRPNYLYAIVSVSLVLFLLGFCGLVVIYAQRLVTAFKERVNVLIELEESTAPEQVATIKTGIEESVFVKPGTVQLISKEDAARSMAEAFGEDYSKLDMPNPYRDMLSFNVRAAYMASDSLNRIKQAILQEAGVAEVFYQENIVDNIAGNVGRFAYAALVVCLFFILIAIVLIHNTVRLALYANRFIIKNMQLVGASWEFISRPYLQRAILHGLLSGVIAIGVLLLLVFWAQKDLPELKSLQDIYSFALLFSILIVLGILINTMSTYFVVRKYLKMRVDDLY